MKPKSEAEAAIFEVWKERTPARTFSAGLEEYAGRMFIPDQKDIDSLLSTIRKAKEKATDPVEEAFSRNLELWLLFEEPYQTPDEGLWAFFRHLVVEGVVPSHLISLAQSVARALEVARERYSKRDWPAEILISVCNKCSGLNRMIETITSQTTDKTLISKLEALKKRVDGYRATFDVEGVKEGDFAEIFPILKDLGGDVGRKDVYPQIMKDRYDFPETPEQFEELAMGWLDEELPILKELTEELADKYGCDPVSEIIEKESEQRRAIKKSEILDFVNGFRGNITDMMNERLVRITPNYETRLMETPPYLIHFIPTAAMSTFGELTSKPFNIFFVSTDEKRSPPSGSPMLFQIIVHEEFGHCVNYSNTATRFAANPGLMEGLHTTFSLAVSDGISFHRELESLNLLKELVEKSALSPAEKRFMSMVRKYEDFDTWLLEVEFEVYKWRIVRFLRAISDSRINMGRQSLVDFVEWAHKRTDLSKKTIFNQIFIFQSMVGYAPVYSVVGQSLRRIQGSAREAGKDIVDFNTYASSLGFGPRQIFEERLRDWIAS
ncbi:MAG: hypothetical protein ACE5QW_03040 [Thermoplasmata archaeon]